MRVANDVLATSPGHAVKRGLTHQCAVGLGPRVLRSGYQHDLRRRPSFIAMFRDERARGLAVKLMKGGRDDPSMARYPSSFQQAHVHRIPFGERPHPKHAVVHQRVCRESPVKGDKMP